jgi:hypothetical protein
MAGADSAHGLIATSEPLRNWPKDSHGRPKDGSQNLKDRFSLSRIPVYINGVFGDQPRFFYHGDPFISEEPVLRSGRAGL